MVTSPPGVGLLDLMTVTDRTEFAVKPAQQ